MTSKATNGFGLLMFLSGVWDVASVFVKQTISFGAVVWFIGGVLSVVVGLIMLGQTSDRDRLP